MILKRVSYQLKAVNQLVESTEKFLECEEKKSLIIFKSPTGSGKTVMAGQYIKNLISKYNNKVCFVWLSIGKGELHIQSKNKLEKMFNGSPAISLLEDDYIGGKNSINNGEVVVVNWEKINSKDTDGNWSNILMRDGEKLNFRDVLRVTRENDIKIVLIIDESHIGSDTERTNDIVDEILPDVIVEMTATPKFGPTFIDDMAEGKSDYIKVNIKDVIKEEMVKKKFVINEGLSELDGKNCDIEKIILQLAYDKREELKLLFEEENSKVNPLIVVQIPNGSEGKRIREIVEEILDEIDVTLENNKLAIWLDDEKHNLENLSLIDNEVEVLIFKQAIDTGWDCPRAQILVKYRQTASEIFERQILGRILRMPEQKHYDDENLNKSYIYTNYEGKHLELMDNEFDYPSENYEDISIKSNKDFDNITLPQTKCLRTKKDVIEENIDNAFDLILEERGLKHLSYQTNKEKLTELDLNISNLTKDVMGELELDIEDIFEKNKADSSLITFTFSDSNTQSTFDKLISKYSQSIGNDKLLSSNIIKNNIYKLICEYIIDIESLPYSLIDIQKIFILNYNKIFSKIIIDVINRYKSLTEESLYEISILDNLSYSIPKIDSLNSDIYEILDYEKYFYDKCALRKDRSEPEKAFEQYIQNNLDDIKYWVKNGDVANKYFSMDYSFTENDKLEVHDFYPDYIIVYNDNTIGIFEAKDKNDSSIKTKAKAEKLYKYINQCQNDGLNIIGGIVANFGIDTNYIKINNNEIYSIDENYWIDINSMFVNNSNLN